MSPSAPASRSRQNRTAPSPRTRMPTLFNTIRASIYGSVLLFTIICLGMAGHLQAVLTASDLTRFVPFAIFVCSASLFIIVVLLATSVILRERNPISTRIELASLGLAGIFWLVLGVYLTTSDSQDADVECFALAGDTQPLDESLASFHTDQYQAMYRVLMSFSLINATLVLAACLALLFLAVRKHRKGDQHMWYGPVTSCAWFNAYGNPKQGSRGKTSSSSILPITRGSTQERKDSKRQGSNSQSRREYTEKPPKPYPKTYQTTEKPSRQSSGKSGKSGNSGQSSYIGSYTNEFDNGGMMNPYRNRQGR